MGSRGILIINDNGRYSDLCIPEDTREVLIEIRRKFLSCKTPEDAVALKESLRDDVRFTPLGGITEGITPECDHDVYLSKGFSHHLKVEISPDGVSVGMVIGAIEETVKKPLMWRADLSVGDTWLDGTTGFSGLSEKQFDKQMREGVSCINSGIPDFFAGMGNGY